MTSARAAASRPECCSQHSVLAHDAVHGRHLGILLVEGGVGITVTCAMTLIFYFFAGRRHARELDGIRVKEGSAEK